MTSWDAFRAAWVRVFILRSGARARWTFSTGYVAPAVPSHFGLAFI